MAVGGYNIINEPPAERKKIILSTLHITLGLIKQLVEAHNKDGNCFQHICTTFPGLSNEKLKDGLFDGPQIRTLTKDATFVNSMNGIESSAWNYFVKVVQTFLGNNNADNYEELVNSMLNKSRKHGANMIIKVHCLHSHLNRFPDNFGDLSEEQGERFHQYIKVMEERYQKRWENHMMAEYC